MVNFNRPRLQFDDFAVARQIVGTFALDLDGGVLRRDLLDHAGELRQQVANRPGGGPDIAGSGDPALGIVGIAFLAPAYRKAITLAAVHHERNRLGGLAHGDRKPAGGERIERAGVAGAPGLEQPLHDRDRMGRGHADRLVEHDPAMDVALVAPGLVVLARLLAAAGAVVARIIVPVCVLRAVAIRIRRNIFFGAVRIANWLFGRAVYGGHDHQVTLPNLAGLVRGPFAPRVFSSILLILGFSGANVSLHFRCSQ